MVMMCWRCRWSKTPVVGANQYFDVVLGFFLSIVALGVAWYYFKGAVYRRLMRTEQSFAVEVTFTLVPCSLLTLSLSAQIQLH